MKKIISVIFLATILILSITTYINAAQGQSMSLTLKVEEKEYNVGDEILVDVYVDEIIGFSGLNTFTAKKVYEKECLEYKETIVNEGWELVGDATNIVLRKMEGEDLAKGKLCTLKFKALKNTTSTVTLTEVDACNNDGDVYYEDKNVNAPSVQVSVEGTRKKISTQKNYTGIILIGIGIAGLIGTGICYKITKK